MLNVAFIFSNSLHASPPFLHLNVSLMHGSYLPGGHPVRISDVQQEKTHNNLIQGVESFERKSLIPTEVNEKIVLPNAEGKCF